MLKFKNGLADGVTYRRAFYVNGPITPELIIVHDTAGRLTKGNSADYLLTKHPTNRAKASIHFVVERDGTFEQQVPINRGANHAGPSRYHGRSGVSGFSVGIEIVNPGKMERGRSGVARAWWGQDFNIEDYGIQAVTTPEHGAGLWMPCTQAQLETVEMLCRSLAAAVPTINDIQPHWYISPGRKVDTNPLFPLAQLRAAVLGTDGPEVDAPDDDRTEAEFVLVINAPTGLNLRRWPSFNPNVLASIPNGAAVPVLARGRFEGMEWFKTVFNGQTGWAAARYTTKET